MKVTGKVLGHMRRGRGWGVTAGWVPWGGGPFGAHGLPRRYYLRVCAGHIESFRAHLGMERRNANRWGRLLSND